MFGFGKSSRSEPRPATFRDFDRAAKQRAREAEASAARRRRHREAVIARGDAAGIPFERKRGLFGRR